jgi:predicted PhzF superfamily epimerase YddE/YHI9
MGRPVDTSALCDWDGYTRGVIVSCVPGTNENEEVDFLSRFFGPKAGILEDPVTGSAHCVLAPYYCAKLGKDKVLGRQMSARGGVVDCQLTEDTVTITGTAVTAVSGTLWL